MGTSLPAVAHRKWLAQQSSAVFQRADVAGNWIRRTDVGIKDNSLSRLVRAVEATAELAREIKHIEEHSNIKVGGMRTVEVGTILSMYVGLRADLGTLSDLYLTGRVELYAYDGRRGHRNRKLSHEYSAIAAQRLQEAREG